MAITNMQVVTGYYDSLGTPDIATVVSGHLSAGWIPQGAPVLTDVYGQVAQSMVKSDNLSTTAYTVVTGATPMAPDNTWDTLGNPTWIESGRYLQAYTKGDQVTAKVDLSSQVDGVLPVANGGTGVNVQSALWGAILPTGSAPLNANPVNPMDATTKSWVESTLSSSVAPLNANTRNLWSFVLDSAGFTLASGSFETGASLTTNRQALWYEAEGKPYIWAGALPKTVTPESTPASSGGISPSAWIVAPSDINVKNVTALRAVEPVVSGQRISVNEHSIKPNFGGGEFYAVLNATGLVDDNGLIFKTPNGHAWIRDVGSEIDPFMFGAVGDGIVNDATALKQAASSGKDVNLRKYTYLFNTATMLPPSNVLIHNGKLLKTTYSTDIPLVGTGDAPKFIYVGENVKNVYVNNIEFDYTGALLPRVFGVVTMAADNVTVKKCRFIGNETAMFVWKLSKNIFIEKNTIKKGQFGIATGGDNNGNTNGVVSNVVMTNNMISECNSEAIDINWDTQIAYITENTTYGNNIVDGEEEIDVGGGVCSDIYITDNVINGGSGSTRGVQIKEVCRRVHVRNNTITTSATPVALGAGVALGTYAGGSQDVFVEGNTISGFDSGIYALRDHTNVYINGNNINVAGTTSSSFGIQVDMGTSYHVIVNDNKVVGGASLANGIQLDNIDGGVVSGNNVSGFLSGYGVRLGANVRHLKCTENTSRNNNNGMVVTGVKNIVTDNQLFGNRVRGMLLEGGFNTITDNDVFDNNTLQAANVYGIAVAAGCNFSIISNNNVFDTRTTRYQNGISFGVSDRCIVTYNNCLPNAGTAISGLAGLTNSQTAGNIVS